MILFEVAPVLQINPDIQLEATSVTGDPLQILVVDAVIVGLFAIPTTICWIAVPAQIPVPQVAVYVLVSIGFTIILAEISPVFHMIPNVQFDAVMVTLSPAQLEVLVATKVGINLETTFIS